MNEWFWFPSLWGRCCYSPKHPCPAPPSLSSWQQPCLDSANPLTIQTPTSSALPAFPFSMSSLAAFSTTFSRLEQLPGWSPGWWAWLVPLLCCSTPVTVCLSDWVQSASHKWTIAVCLRSSIISLYYWCCYYQMDSQRHCSHLNCSRD